MDGLSFNRGWMYDRCYSGRRGLKESFIIGVEEFVQKARQYKYYELDGGIRCPCLKCDCTRILKDEVVKVHLYKQGFKPNYWIWTDHGENMQDDDLNVDDNCMSDSSTNVHIRKDTGRIVNKRSRKTHEKKFETRLSPARSEVASCAGDIEEVNAVDPMQEEMIRTKCCVEVVGEKKKRRLYDTGEIVSNYTGGNDSLKHQRSTSCKSKDLNDIRQDISALEESTERLTRKIQTLQSLFMQFLPLSPADRSLLQQQFNQNEHALRSKVIKKKI